MDSLLPEVVLPCLELFCGMRGRIARVSVNGDGHVLMKGCTGKREDVIVWDVETRKCLQGYLVEYTNFVYVECDCFDPDGSVPVIRAHGNSVRYWEPWTRGGRNAWRYFSMILVGTSLKVKSIFSYKSTLCDVSKREELDDSTCGHAGSISSTLTRI